jgi:sec-independent protein translocase protein TatA
MIGGWEIPALVVAAIVLFGADKVPKLARGLGQAKKEFMVGQVEADVAAERARAEARAQAEAAATSAVAVQPAEPAQSSTTTPAAPHA